MPLSHYGLTTVMHSYTVNIAVMSAVNIARLQRTHNTAASLIMRCPRSDTATPFHANSTGCPLCAELISSYLYSLTKPCTTTRQCILCDLVCPYQPKSTLRSANNDVLEVKRTRTKAGDCSFAVAAASLWNNLPTVVKTCDNLTSFKRRAAKFPDLSGDLPEI